MKFQADKYARMVEHLEKRGLTISQIMSRYSISRRTAFRWIEYVKTEGYFVIKFGSGSETKYHIDTGD